MLRHASTVGAWSSALLEGLTVSLPAAGPWAAAAYQRGQKRNSAPACTCDLADLRCAWGGRQDSSILPHRWISLKEKHNPTSITLQFQIDTNPLK